MFFVMFLYPVAAIPCNGTSDRGSEYSCGTEDNVVLLVTASGATLSVVDVAGDGDGHSECVNYSESDHVRYCSPIVFSRVHVIDGFHSLVSLIRRRVWRWAFRSRATST